ncbi:bifunctional glutamate--cysteine ligase GshA/glutathione synthetase GshB [Streptococcus oricebi]|uniref:Glutathione biosynthesis bifunctional protein GshAB n=1 Tax=Streptococcus oricebi TaxID=1547447 RepID=A0ABS5B510_9STRE|nr:bifunctional glutamate--cysteine ligase GshA/glutathione synthetase GshB [Streptococcus oricebi]MBP2623895.1 bifunctional glutamate--cysteine ligase/glutathione synthetase [Streptococcus oricebi]
MTTNQLLQKLAKTAPILEASFGLEREGLRVKRDGQLTQSQHPRNLGSRNFHPYIQTDFSEQQLEFITPATTSSKEALRILGAITDVSQRSLEPDEQIWPLSMPPKLEEKDIQIAQLDDEFELNYRHYLAQKYGKKLQAISGIHYNFGLGADLLQQIFEQSQETDFSQFKNQLYLKLARNFLRYRWLFTYLYGAAPLAEAGFLTSDISQPVRSFRNSQLGYVNESDLHFPYTSLEAYITSIENYVQQERLIAEKECYAPVRFRGQKKNRDYLSQGVTYLEFRSFDLNPFEALGINQETLDSVHLLLLALLWLDDSEETVTEDLTQAQQINNQVALSHPLSPLPEQAQAQPLITALDQLIQHFQLDSYYQDLVQQIKRALQDPRETLAGKLLPHIDNQSLQAFGQKQAQVYHDYAWQAPYALKGYEGMELSTQMLLFDVIQKGLSFEILDEEDQFLKLWHKDHIEYVKNGNMTSKDDYVMPLAMANKTVTKKILAAAGFRVPQGAEFSQLGPALAYFSRIKDQAIVVKPKSTNFGLGISIFQEAASYEAYQKALELAFSEDSSVLVEEFIPGTEYRFFILDGKCEAVLLRLAANVQGDGQKTIRELVEQKNANPLRGSDHRSPLEKIQLGPIEQLMLQQQGYQAEDVLEKGVTVYLRGNSNISTGGDSVDVTEDMHPSYKELAAQMAQAMKVWACGVDLIIPDSSLAASKEEPHSTCIELNFNPSMYMHTYCAQGPGQALTPKILAKLFPELEE